MPTLNLLFCLGLCSLVFQTLLFREFISVFEGNELGLGAFFGSWLVWVAVGALVGKFSKWFKKVCRFQWLLLLYIPAYLLQQQLIINSRMFAGVTPQELFPFTKMLAMAFLANWPVSFVSGLLFVVACHWLDQQQKDTPVTHVYIFEVIGSTIGGILVTFGLGSGFASETIFLYTFLLLLTFICIFQLTQHRSKLIITLPLLIIVLLSLGMDQQWNQYRSKKTWERLLPLQGYTGRFTTPHASYFYGEYKGQFNVIAQETITDIVVDTEHPAEVAAIHLAQNPQARNILVIGPNTYSLCKRLLILPQIENVTWLHPDPDYPHKLIDVLPAEQKIQSEHLNIPTQDARLFVAESDIKYDLVILSSLDVTTLSLNRYFTLDFLQNLKNKLNPGGVVGLRCAAGENFMSPELVNLGASLHYTLEQVFDNIVIKPGEETWFIASDTAPLSENAPILQQRFAAIDQSEKLYPSVGLYSLYLKDRITFQRQKYQHAIESNNKRLLLNTDKHPTVLLHTLISTIRHINSNWSFAAILDSLKISLWAMVILAIVLFVILRFFYMLGSPKTISVGYLIISTGFAGLALNILLMFMFQAQYGSIYLFIGLIAALFMAGLGVGGYCTKMLIAKKGQPSNIILFLYFGLSLQIVFCLFLLSIPAQLPMTIFIPLFLIAGLLGGIYVPIAAYILQTRNISAQNSGGIIDVYDHVGGAVGGLLIGIILLPILGINLTLSLLIALLIVNYFPSGDRKNNKLSGDQWDENIRTFAYILIGLIILLFVFQFIHRSIHKPADDPFSVIAKKLSSETTLNKKSETLSDGTEVQYFLYKESTGKPAGYIFSTKLLTTRIAGYGGPIELAVKTDKNGSLLDIDIISSKETPRYMQRCMNWWEQLYSQNIFTTNALHNVDTLTGATYTSRAIKQALQQSGINFATLIKHPSINNGQVKKYRKIEPAAIVLLFLVAGAFILRKRRNKTLRNLFLLTVVILNGIIFNSQYSMNQVFALLKFEILSPAFSMPFLLAAIIPGLIILFGNFYCGYLCPFGALQELVSSIIPRKYRIFPRNEIWRYGRWVKYGLLFCLLIIAILLPKIDLSETDPLTTFWAKPGIWLAVIAIVISIVFGRFWCRNLCPTGAFLALLNGIRLLKSLIPKVPWPNCIYGIRNKQELDCICCDRCFTKKPNKKPSKWVSPLFLILVLGMGLWFCNNISNVIDIEPVKTSKTQPEIQKQTEFLPGQIRSVNTKRLKKLIEANRLSDREAKFYHVIDK